jgi:hypothetical protein
MCVCVCGGGGRGRQAHAGACVGGERGGGCETDGCRKRVIPGLIDDCAGGVGFTADKRYQLADWRIRPLPQHMIAYARADTRYVCVWGGGVHAGACVGGARGGGEIDGRRQRVLPGLIDDCAGGVGFTADKRYQLADWRIRPLPQHMINYARADTR